MEEKQKELDTLKLGNELMVRRYLFNKMQISHILDVPDYIALYTIRETGKKEDIYAGKTYLQDLSEKMHLTIRQTSKMIGKLKERGLVTWSHDGNGSAGTYVTITETGNQLVEQQQVVLNKYYGNVIEKFGRDNLIELLNLMKQLETILDSELEGMEEAEYADGEVE